MAGPINNISLVASQAYNKVNSKSFGEGLADTGIGASVAFEKMVQNNFNAYATMSSEQILSHIKNAKSITNPSSGFVENTIASARATLKNSELVTKKALIGEASILQLATSTTQAQNTVKTIVAFRDQFSQMWDKIFNMQL